MYKQESEEQKKYLQKLKARKRLITALRILLLIFIFVFWEAVTRFNWLDPFIFSSPGRMLNTFIRLYNEGSLMTHILLHYGKQWLDFIRNYIWHSYCNYSLVIETCSRVLEPYLVVANALENRTWACFYCMDGAGRCNYNRSSYCFSDSYSTGSIYRFS